METKRTYHTFILTLSTWRLYWLPNGESIGNIEKQKKLKAK